MRYRAVWAVAALAATALAAGAWAQEKQAQQPQNAGANMEGQIQRAGFTYYYATIFGDVDEYLKVTRMPLFVVHDGTGTYRDEKATRALLAGFAEHTKAAKLTNDDKKQILKNLITLFDQASVQFVGANTATLTFLARRGATEKEGDHLCTLTLYRKDGTWKVISELTDSAAVPPEYVKGP